MQTSLTYLQQDLSGNVAFHLKVSSSAVRTPIHFLTLLDVSESMMDENKLVNVKRCMSLLLKFLSHTDKLSIVTFGEESTIVVKGVKAEPLSIPMLEQAIESLVTHGCTNFSAGLGSIREILDELGDCQLKPSLLVLTDGHANRGASTPSELQTIVKRIRELFPTLSMSFIAYGTDHNADLMNVLAEETLGTYSIVKNLEDAALTMGDALGGAISCVAQNVAISVPEGTTVEGPFKVVNNRIELGDIYAGSEKLILLKKPEGTMFLSGVSLPSLDPFKREVTMITTDTSRNAEIDLTRLRYECARLFQVLRTQQHVELANFRAAINDPFLAGNPVTAMLQSELASLEAAQELLQNGMSNHIYSQLAQHERYTSTGGGTSSVIVPRRTIRFARSTSDPTADSDDETITQTPMSGGQQTPMVGEVQRQIASMMRQASHTPVP